MVYGALGLNEANPNLLNVDLCFSRNTRNICQTWQFSTEVLTCSPLPVQRIR
jgi:hypothetical protein